MTIRNAVFGLAVVFGASVWSWCRPCGEVHARGAEPAVTASSGTHDEAAARFRCNQSRHWRHVALGR